MRPVRQGHPGQMAAVAVPAPAETQEAMAPQAHQAAVEHQGQMEAPEPVAYPDQAEALEPLPRRVQAVRLGQAEHRPLPVPPDHPAAADQAALPEMKALQAAVGLLVHQVRLHQLAPLALPAVLAQVELRGPMEVVVRAALPAVQALRAHMALRAHQEVQDLRGHPVLLAVTARVALQEPPGQKAMLEVQGRVARRVLMGHLERVEHRGVQAPVREQAAHPVLQVRPVMQHPPVMPVLLHSMIFLLMSTQRLPRKA